MTITLLIQLGKWIESLLPLFLEGASRAAWGQAGGRNPGETCRLRNSWNQGEGGWTSLKTSWNAYTVFIILMYISHSIVIYIYIYYIYILYIIYIHIKYMYVHNSYIHTSTCIYIYYTSTCIYIYLCRLILPPIDSPKRLKVAFQNRNPIHRAHFELLVCVRGRGRWVNGWEGFPKIHRENAGKGPLGWYP